MIAQRVAKIRFRLAQRNRRGISLIELLLALALSVLILSAITGAIFVYYITLTRQQLALEQKQIVRSVVLMIHNDLRSALQYKAADVAGIENMDITQALMAGIPGMGGGSMGGDSEGDDAGGEPSGSTEDNSNWRPRLIGTSDRLVIDVSRLPRIDQYNSLVIGDDGVYSPSDIKSIAYLISDSGREAQTTEFESEIAELGGLYRREIDRAFAAYRGESGPPQQVDQFCRLIAPEVVGIQLRYFDGSDWVDSWDSEEEERFPLAIEVNLAFDPARVFNVQVNDRTSQSNDATDEIQRYRAVVHLPIAEPPPEE